MKSLLAPFALSALLLIGCGPTPPSDSRPSGVALLDIEAVAKRIGRDTVIAEELKTAGTALGQKLTGAQKGYQDEFVRSREAMGPKPSPADSEKLAEMGRDFTTQFQKKQQEAQQELIAKRVALVNRFREEIKPLAMKIATGRNLGIVLIKSEPVVLGNDPAVEITDDVVAELTRQEKPSATAAPTAK